jgi:hypothetical protein
MQHQVKCMLSDFLSFTLPEPYLGEDNMVRQDNKVRTTICLIYGVQITYMDQVL